MKGKTQRSYMYREQAPYTFFDGLFMVKKALAFCFFSRKILSITIQIILSHIFWPHPTQKKVATYSNYFCRMLVLIMQKSLKSFSMCTTVHLQLYVMTMHTSKPSSGTFSNLSKLESSYQSIIAGQKKQISSKYECKFQNKVEKEMSGRRKVLFRSDAVCPTIYM